MNNEMMNGHEYLLRIDRWQRFLAEERRQTEGRLQLPYKSKMKLRHAFLAWFFILFALATCQRAHAQQTVIRDAGGRTIGTATTDSGGQTTFRDAGGRTTGTATMSNQGSAGRTTTFRNEHGQTTGSASSPWRK